jgi:hypothetical protein
MFNIPYLEAQTADFGLCFISGKTKPCELRHTLPIQLFWAYKSTIPNKRMIMKKVFAFRPWLNGQTLPKFRTLAKLS